MRDWNIVLITADQLRADALGCYGNSVIKTPHIDALAGNGICFDQVFTAFPVCSPNRGSMATGRYPSVHGLRRNGCVLPETELTLMEVLRRHGWHTCGSGKMHFGPQWRKPPTGGPLVDPSDDLAVNPQPDPWQLPWYGFEEVVLSEDNRVGPYADYLSQHGYSHWDDAHSFSYPQHQCVRSVYPEEHHQTTWVADRAIAQIEAHDTDSPLFCWCSFVHPHHPFNPPAPFDTLYDPKDMPLPQWREGEDLEWPEHYRRKFSAKGTSHEAIGMCDVSDEEWQTIKAFYYGMVSLIDKQVGRIVESLRGRGMLEKTLIVFTSDHGEMLGDHHLVFKGTTFDEVTRTPLIVSRPDEAHGGQRRAALGNTVDLMPTILDLCGIDVPKSVQGVSLRPAFEQETFTPREATLIEFNEFRTIRTRNTSLTWHGCQKRGELYDLTNDPSCSHNLWDSPEADELKRSLLDQLFHLVSTNFDPLPLRLGAC